MTVYEKLKILKSKDTEAKKGLLFTNDDLLLLQAQYLRTKDKEDNDNLWLAYYEIAKAQLVTWIVKINPIDVTQDDIDNMIMDCCLKMIETLHRGEVISNYIGLAHWDTSNQLRKHKRQNRMLSLDELWD